MTTITPTRLPGLRAAIARAAAAVSGAVLRIPAWQAVSLVMAGAAMTMAALGPSTLAV